MRKNLGYTTNLMRRCLLVAGLVAMTAVGQAAIAAPKFDRPISLVVGYPPGGAADIVARLLAPRLGEALGTSVVVENRAGANGTIGANQVAKSKPDGHTLLLSSLSPLVLTPQTMADPPFDATKAFSAVNMVGRTPEGIALNPKLQINTLSDFLSYAKDKEVTLSSSGNGGLPHLTIELLKAASNGRIVHVAYKGAGPAITDTMAGHVDGVVMDLPALLPLIKDGRLKGLAVTGTERSRYVPELPAVAESINDFEVYNWIGLFVSSGTPADTIAYLDKTVREIMQNDELRTSLDETGMAPTVRADAADFQQFFNEEHSRWGNFLRTSNIQLN